MKTLCIALHFYQNLQPVQQGLGTLFQIILFQGSGFLNKKTLKLESEKKALKQIIKKDKKIIKQLKNIDSLERFAREEYGHKKENELIFIIEMNDSLTN